MANFKLSYNDSEDEFGSYEDESEAKGANWLLIRIRVYSNWNNA